MGGNPRKPTAKKVAEGTYRADRAPANEPQPSTERPRCPSWLRQTAKDFWARLLPELESQGCLGRIDGTILSRYCEMWARWVAASKVLQAEGETYTVRTSTGTVVRKRPEVDIVKELDAAMRRTEVEFGMSPASRTKIEATTPQVIEDTSKRKFFEVVG